MGYIEQLEQRIKVKIRDIENNKISPNDEKIGILFNALKDRDQASYENLLLKYMSVINKK